MPRDNLSKLVALTALIILLVALPFFVKEYYVHILITLIINVIIVVSFRLITTMGDWSMAHIPIMGLGGYATAILTTTLGWPFWLTLPLGGLASALFALIISNPLVRTKGFAFFIASAAFGEAMRLTCTRLRVPFGGHQGISHIPVPESILGVDFSQAIPYYFLALVITVLCVVIMYRVEWSRIGDSFKAITSSEDLSKSVGIDTFRYKTLALVIGSFFAGIAGVLFAHFNTAVEPRSLGFIETMYLLVWVVFGGTKTFAGPIMGLAMLTVVHELLLPLEEWIPLFYGIILILTLLFLRGGLESVPKRLSSWVRKVRGGTQG